jgi:serine protease Do
MRNFCVALVMIGLTASAGFARAPDVTAPTSFADVVAPLVPAVVNISTTQKVKAPRMAEFEGLPPELENDPALAPFRELFRGFGGVPGGKGARTQKVTSLGSGFVVDADGFIVTNNHVIADATEVTVTFHDNTKLKAKIIGKDEKTDLALLKVNSKSKLAHVAFGDSDKARVGDWVVAIGNPFGLGGSVTAGIVSARGRNINAGAYDDFIQTDAAINRGNSGGPLFNMSGEVIGVNSAIFSPTGTNIGIGFSVPASLAEPVIAQLKKFGKIHRGWLGVKIQPVTDEIAQSIGLKEPRGALILDVTPNGPAAGSGIAPGDVITALDGKEVSETHSLPRIVADTPIGKRAEVTVWRKGESKRFTITLGELPDDPARAGNKEEEQEGAVSPTHTGRVLGLEVSPLMPEQKQRYQLPSSVSGLLVVKVLPNSDAADKGLRAGDAVIEANQQPVTSVEAFKAQLAAARKAGREFILLRVARGNDALFVTLAIK